MISKGKYSDVDLKNYSFQSFLHLIENNKLFKELREEAHYYSETLNQYRSNWKPNMGQDSKARITMSA